MKSVYMGYIYKSMLHFKITGDNRHLDTDIKIPLHPQDYWVKDYEGSDVLFNLHHSRAVIHLPFYSIR